MKHIKKSAELTFADFRRLAKNTSLTKNEKIDFPESYRHGHTGAILADIISKLSLTDKRNQIICDIGCGCGDLAHALIGWSQKRKHTLLLVDSEEMLTELPNSPGIKKFPGKFPVSAVTRRYRGKVAAVLCYSVLQYVYGRQSIYTFIGEALKLLAPGGVLLIGDIPNEDKRNRFLGTPEGAPFRKTRGRARAGKIGDSVILSVMIRFRRLGYETYLVPQPKALPMADRRDDVLIVKRV